MKLYAMVTTFKLMLNLEVNLAQTSDYKLILANIHHLSISDFLP